jgi:hypothetical protein
MVELRSADSVHTQTREREREKGQKKRNNRRRAFLMLFCYVPYSMFAKGSLPKEALVR